MSKVLETVVEESIPDGLRADAEAALAWFNRGRDVEFEVSFLDAGPSTGTDSQMPAELDPPPGALRGGLDRAVGQHAFHVLVFYRGSWRPPCRSELRSHTRGDVAKKIRAAGRLYIALKVPWVGREFQDATISAA